MTGFFQKLSDAAGLFPLIEGVENSSPEVQFNAVLIRLLKKTLKIRLLVPSEAVNWMLLSGRRR